MRETIKKGTGTALRWRALMTVITVLAAILSFIVVSPSFYARLHAASPSASATGGWFTYAYTQGRTGYNPNETIINPTSASSIKLLWSVTTGSIISVQPIVANGKIYWGAWDGILHATRTDGTQAWTANLGRTPTP